ncbi:helix-turn-helix domain-containing protein [Streptomyces sp. NBC_01485]|uniref:helix-turn-helix domain-containing protein n=1 Tax=Streptomyces sp. NBC_01485 TaxID=2903884 RepID=UPI002E340681|nr:helix-turn-helix transcriptional regulator [Streptomyces sp. NBC_01485]
MPAHTRGGVGARIAYYRSVMRPKLTQQQLAVAACLSVGAIRKIEQGERRPGDATLEAIAAALGVDPSRLRSDRDPAHTPVHESLPALSAALAAYDIPEDIAVRPAHELRLAVEAAAQWRLAAQYTRIVRQLPVLLGELACAFHQAPAHGRAELAKLMVSAYRSADAVAYKFGARDLSARLIDLMRWIAPEAEDPLLAASVAYVRTETFFAARAHAPGLRALEQAIDAAPSRSVRTLQPSDASSAPIRSR